MKNKAVLIIIVAVAVLLVIGSLTLPLLFLGLYRNGNIAKATEFSPGSVTEKVYATAYCPKDSKLEGGFNDEKGHRLQTLQQFLSGQAGYVSVAMDKALRSQGYPYGTRIHIPELEKKYSPQKPIEFRLVDNGGAFNGTSEHPLDHQKKPRGLTAIDIGVACDFLDHGWSNLYVTLVFEGHSVAPRSDGSGQTFSCQGKTYAFPILDSGAGYAHSHHNYSATDIYVLHNGQKVEGATVVAVTSGRVTRAGNDGGKGGNRISLVGDDGLTYYFAHLQNNSIVVKVDQQVKAGQPMAKLGETGDARGTFPHLHLGISDGNQTAGWYPDKVSTEHQSSATSNWKVLDAWRAGKCIDPRS